MKEKEKLEVILSNLKNKKVLLTNTFEKNSFQYNLAHFIRNYSKILFCIDNKYKMSDEPEDFRIIENGKVVLIKGDYYNDYEKIMNIIGKFTTKLDYVIDIK